MADYKLFLNGVNGQITVYENRVVIERKGVLGFMTQGLAGEKTIPMNSIMSVQFKEGNMWTNGFIQFGVMGGRESVGGVLNAAADENTVMVKQSENYRAREIKDYIENIILNREKNQNTVVQQISPADELKKFKELLDMGIINQEEFQTKKEQLLKMI